MRNPFIAGSWVRGDNFFGRADILRDILEGARDSLWVVGARRLGKTSLLKELERRVQGSAADALRPAVLGPAGQRATPAAWPTTCWAASRTARPSAAPPTSAVEDLEGLPVAGHAHHPDPPHGAQRVAAAAARGRGRGVPGRGARPTPSSCPACAASSRRGPEVRTVFTSTKRLARIDERTDFATSPFLLGFIPPLYLTPLAADEARALLGRGQFAADEVELVLARTACHPFLVQLIASRLFETHDLAATLDQVAVGRDGGQLLLGGLPDPRPRGAHAPRGGGPRRHAQPPGPRAVAAAHRGRHRAAALRPRA